MSRRGLVGVIGRTAKATASMAMLVAAAGGPSPGQHVTPRPAPPAVDRTARAPSGCWRAPRKASIRPPAPIVFTTRCGRYELASDGALTRIGPRPRPDRRIRILWGDGTGAGIERRGRSSRVVLYRDGRRVWTSTRTFQVLRRPRYPDMVALGNRSVAFSFPQGRLWVAPIDGSEHPVAYGELPVLWTPAGDLVTARWRHGGAQLLLRSADGETLRPVTPWTRWYVVDHVDRSIVYVRSGRLLRFDGRKNRVLADLRSLRLGSIQADVEILEGGLIWVEGRRRGAVLEPDGRVLGTAWSPGWNTRHGFGPPAYPVADPAGSAVAFVRTRRSPSANAVLLLRPGGRTDRIYEHPADLAGCGWGVTLQWLGGWLLYSTSAAQGAVLDTTGRTSPIRLDRLIKPGVLPGSFDRDIGVQVAWAQEGGTR